MTVLWNGDFETGDFSQYAQQQEVAADRITIATSVAGVKPPQGNYAARVLCKPTDTNFYGSGSWQRTELNAGTQSFQGAEGAERWFGYMIRLDPGFPYPSVSGRELILGQVHASAGSPLWSFNILNKSGTVGIWIRSRHGDYTQFQYVEDFYKAPQREIWYRIKFHHIWSTDPATGLVETWIDDGSGWVKVMDRVKQTLYTNASPSGLYWKVGVYGYPESTDRVLHVDACCTATTEAEIDSKLGAAGGGGGGGTGGTLPTTGIFVGKTTVPAAGSFHGTLANYKRVSGPWTVEQSGWYSGIYAYTRSGTVDAVRAGLVHSDNGGFPDVLLATTDPVTIVAGTPDGWVYAPLTEPVYLEAGQKIHVGFHSGGPDNSYLDWKESLFARQHLRYDGFADGASNPWAASEGGGTSGVYDNEFSYCLYASSGTGGGGSGQISRVQQTSPRESASATTHTVSLPSAASAGRLIVTAIAVDKSAGSFTPPAGFTIIQEMVGAQSSGAIAYKVAAGGEQTFTWTLGTAQGATLWVAEYAGNASAPLDVSAESPSDFSVTSKTSGTTPATAAGSAFAIAMFASDTGFNVDAGRAYTNGFVEAYAAGMTSGGPGLTIAELSLSGGSAVETTFSTTDVGDEMYGAVAVFKAASGTTPTGETLGKVSASTPWPNDAQGRTLGQMPADTWYGGTGYRLGNAPASIAWPPEGTPPSAAPTRVQQGTFQTTTNALTHTVSLPAAAQAGNLIVVALAVDTDSGTITPPTGFTLVQDASGARVSGAIAYKVAAGGEQNFTWTLANSRHVSSWVGEYSGLSSTPLNVSAENGPTPSGVTSLSSGTTAASAAVQTLAVAIFASDTGLNVDLSRSYTNGFTEIAAPGMTNGGPGLNVAEKIAAGGSTVETTFSTTDVGDEMYGAVAVFRTA